MKPSSFYGRALLKAWVLLFFAWQLAGCGGSQVAGGVGSGGSGIAEGSVTGFGSVIVDGVVYGDDSALVARWGESGAAEAKLGQRVRVQHDGNGQAERIVVLPQLIGQANQAPDARGEFWLLGQRVQIVGSDNADYPATVFGGLTEVKAGDPLEVHGSWSRDSQGHDLLLASRIEKLSALPDALLLTAVVMSRNDKSLVLDDAARTSITASHVPDGVQPGKLVSFWLSSGAVQTPASAASPWVATRMEPATLETEQTLRLDMHAVVGETDPVQKRIRVQGLWVKLSDDGTQPLPASGTPVHITLQRQGNDWQASSLSSRRADTQAVVDIKGSLRWRNDRDTLELRGTQVQFSRQLLTGNCKGLRDGDAVYISLKAQRRSPGLPPEVLAIDCSREIPNESVQQAQGQLLGLDAQNNTLDVAVDGTTLTLSWRGERTLMPAVSQLSKGMGVVIEYLRGRNGLVLRKLTVE